MIEIDRSSIYISIPYKNEFPDLTQPNPTQPMIEIDRSCIYVSIPYKNEFPDRTQGILKRRLFVCICFSPGKYICYTYV